jgi:hypothetical protein
VWPAEFTLEWDAVARQRRNALVEASPAVAAQLLEALRPHLRAPVHEYRPEMQLSMPQLTEGTLILLEAANLAPGEQALLLKALTDYKRSVQVVSTSSEALFPRVERGTFDAALYYRLNVVRLTI